MKKLIYVFVLFLAISCSKSPEDKAKDLIKDHLFKSLHDFSSYEPVEFTKIDSAFSDMNDDVTYIALTQLFSEHKEKAEDHLSTMKSWVDSYSSYGRGKYRSAKDELDIELEKLKRIQVMIDSVETNFKVEFIGYSMTHKYRANTLGGNLKLGETKFTFDPEIKEIIDTKSID